MVSCQQAALLPGIPVLSSVVPLFAAVACAVAGASCLRFALSAVLSGETHLLLARVQLAAPTAVPLKDHQLHPGSGYGLPATPERRSLELQLPPSVRDLLLAFNDGARGLARQLSSPRSATQCQPQLTNSSAALRLDFTANSSLEAHPLEFDDADETGSLVWDDTDEDSMVAASPAAIALREPSPLATLGVTAEDSALACMRSDDDCPADVRAELPDEYLLHFGAMIGEQPCVEELQRQRLPWAWGTPGTLMGVPDSPEIQGWEHIVQETTATADYTAWRRPLRKGYYTYKARTVLKGVTVHELAAFNLNVRTRFAWDDSALLVHDLMSPEHHGASSRFQQYRCRYPTPLAPREYVYARRVWDRSDGGCYVVSRACPPPAGSSLAEPGRRVWRVEDYVSCMVVKAAPSVCGQDGTEVPCAEVITVYYENIGMHPGFCGVAIKKGLWGFVQKHEAALRDYAAARRAAAAAAETAAAALGSSPFDSSSPEAEGDKAAGVDPEEAERLLEAGYMQAVRARRAGRRPGLVRSSSALLGRPLRALKPLASLSSHGPLRHRLVLALVFKLMHGLVAACEA